MTKKLKDSAYSFTTKRPVAITMITLAFVIFGILATNKLPLNLMPDLSYPTLTIRTEYPGSAPEEVENSISKPIEQLVGVVNNLESISSISKAGQSDVILEFSWDANIDQAILDVREQLDRFFFEDAEKPLILRYDPTLDPVMRFAIFRIDSAENPAYANTIDYLKKTRRYADEEIKRKLEIVKGVAAVKIKGGLEEEIRVQISEKKLNLLNLNIQTITSRLSSENVNVSGGNIKEGQTEYIVRTLNEFESIDEIRNIMIGFKDGTTPIYLRDIAVVERAHKDREIITRYRDSESVEIEIYKEAEANIVNVSNSVLHKVQGTDEQRNFVRNLKNSEVNNRSQAMTDYLEYQLSKIGLGINLISDQSVFIESSINEVTSTAIQGGFLAIIVLFIFLKDFKSTIIIAITIPVSIVTTFWPMDLFGVSINLMSLGGLALGIGMLVDNAIVVLESIYRCREEGDSFIDSVTRGTQEVGSAVVASTLTTIAVFFPIVFVEGVAGQIFGDMSLTVVFSLIASLVAALYLIPMLASRQLEASQIERFRAQFFIHLSTCRFLETVKTFLPSMLKMLENYHISRWNKVFTYLLPLTYLLLIVATILLLVYNVIKLVLHFVFELIGKMVLTLAWLLSIAFKVFRIGAVQYLLPFLQKTIIKVFSDFIGWIQTQYPKLIQSTLLNKSNTLIMVAIPTMLCFFVILPRIGSELIPQVHQGEFNLEVTYTIGTPVETTSEQVREIEKKIKNIDGVMSVSSRSGIDKAATTKAEEGEHTAKIAVSLFPNENMKDKEDEVITKIRALVENISGIQTKITRNEMFSFKTPIEVFVKGYELEKLKSYSEQTVNLISAVDGIVDVKTNIKAGNPEVHIIYDRQKVARYGLNIFEVASLVRNKVLGDVSTKYRDLDRRIDITVLVDDKYKQSIDDLKRMIINPGQETPIRLSSIASLEIAEGPSEIRREDQERTAIITANVTGDRDLQSIIAEIDDQMQQIQFDDEFFYEIAGQNAEMKTSINSLIAALLLAVFLVYIIMASQFESFVHPFVILFSIPLALVGVFFTLFTFNLTLSIMTYLGMIMLAGIVVNNAIVLVSHINLLRSQGVEKEKAIIEAGRVRLRPILMTTATTVLGLMPMALGLGDGAEMRQPMAVTVIAGLLSSTVLTLIVIPILYAIFDQSDKTNVDNSPTEFHTELGHGLNN